MPPPQPQNNRGSSVPPATLSAARSGSLPALEKVYKALPQCYSLEVFDLFLHQLQGKWSGEKELEKLTFEPKDPPRLLTDRVDAVLLSLGFFGRLPECMQAHPELSKSTASASVTAMPTLLTWLGAYLRASVPDDKRTQAEIQRNPFLGQQDFETGDLPGILRICAVAIDLLWAMLFLDQSTRKRLAQLQLAIQITVVLWVTTVRGQPLMQTASKPPDKPSGARRGSHRRGEPNGAGRTRNTEAALEHGRADRLLEIMRTIAAANPKGVVNVLTSGVVCPMDTFVIQTLKRIRSITTLHRFMARTPRSLPDETYELVNIEHMVEMTQFLMAEPPAREAFFKHESITAFVDLIMVTREHLLKDGLMKGPSYRNLGMITHWSCHIFEWSVYQSGSLLSNLSSIVKAGMLQIAVDSFVCPDKTPISRLSETPEGRVQLLSEIRARHIPGSARVHATDWVDDTKYMLSVLISYASYPRFLPALRRQVWAIPDSALADLQEYEERRVLYRALEAEVSEGSEFLKRRNRITICDNLEHDYTPRAVVPCSKRKLRNPQTCSKCHSVVYCSRECQTRDWAKRHRHECSNAHREYTNMKHSDEWYSHPTRAFHLSLLLDAFELCYYSEKPKTGLPDDSRAFDDYDKPPTVDSIGVRCFDLTAKRGGCIFRPFNTWAVANGGLNMPRWKRKRFGDMTTLLKASHFANVLKANQPVDGPVRATIHQPERYFVDAQFLFGDRILHLFALLRKEDEPKQFGDSSYEYAVEGSLFFSEERKSRKRHENISKSFMWLSDVCTTIFDSVPPAAWAAFVVLLVVGRLLDVL